jgi:drug/metabolite transporter (DMT)-like permease
LSYRIPDHLQSIFWMFAWALFFSGAMALVKCLACTPTITIVLIRYVFSILLITPFLLRLKRTEIVTQQLPRHGLNAFLRVVAIFSTYYAYAKLPLAFAASIGFTGPMIAIILAMFILREKVGVRKWLAVIIGYGGVLVMMQPEQLDATMAIMVALLANLASSLAKIVTKEITRTDSTLQIMLYTNVISLVISAAAAGYLWVTPALADWPILMGIGLLGSLSQFSYLRALDKGQVSLVAPFEYTRLLFAVPLGILFFKEIPTVHAILGGALIIASSAYLTWQEIRHGKYKT